jgi:CheY-like chemotaxis protein/AraC-like DNA-binding protein
MEPSDFSDEEVQNETPTILVVEDDADYRWLIVSGLKDDYHVIEAANGKDGLDKAVEHIPDFVVTDLMMPVLDGIELCRRLKTNILTSHVPVIMLTARTSVESQIKGLETGADDYVTKPFNMQLLKARIHNLLETRRLLRERFSRQLTRSTPNAQEPDHPGSDTLDEPILQSEMDREFWDKITFILRQNFTDPEYNIESLASELNMGQRSLQRKIKALLDRTPVQLIAEYRLKKAAALLLDNTVNITDAAFEAGFGDLSHFYRLFKKEYGMNPTEYRDENL